MKVKMKIWDKVKKEMFTPYAVYFDNHTESVKAVTEALELDAVWSEQMELLLYTGLSDKNDVEIYEGDIIFNEYHEEYGQVDFADGCFSAVYDGWQHELSESNNDSIVVGNVYENLGFLKGENE